MRFSIPDRTLVSSSILVLTAGFLALMVFLTDRRDLTSAVVVISALILFLVGIFLFTFTKKESLDSRISSLLPVQGAITICRIASDLGAIGNAWFLPGSFTNTGSVMQFMPVSSYKGEVLDTHDTFISSQNGTGILVPPAGAILFEELKTRNNLIVPDSEETLFDCIHEIGEELLEVADHVEAVRNGDSIVITFKNYRLTDGCRRLARESPACCTMNPCPICSLFAMVLAEGTGKPLSIDRCQVHNLTDTVTLIFTLLP